MPPDSLLAPLQREFLHKFFSRQIGHLFFLTGGTALTEYYFRHSLSDDIDLFTTNDEALDLARFEIRQIADELNATKEYFLTLADQQFRDVHPPA